MNFSYFSMTQQTREGDPSKTIKMQSKFDTFDMNFLDENENHMYVTSYRWMKINP